MKCLECNAVLMDSGFCYRCNGYTLPSSCKLPEGYKAEVRATIRLRQEEIERLERLSKNKKKDSRRSPKG